MTYKLTTKNTQMLGVKRNAISILLLNTII
jgi:hypothetical protein